MYCTWRNLGVLMAGISFSVCGSSVAKGQTIFVPNSSVSKPISVTETNDGMESSFPDASDTGWVELIEFDLAEEFEPQLQPSSRSDSNLMIAETQGVDFKSTETAKSTLQPDYGELQFADPINPEIYKVVQWTFCVLLIAAVATFSLRARLKSTQTGSTSSRLQLQESIVIDPKTRLYLLLLNGQQAVLATDGTGVKSLTFVPEWAGKFEEMASSLADANEIESRDEGNHGL